MMLCFVGSGLAVEKETCDDKRYKPLIILSNTREPYVAYDVPTRSVYVLQKDENNSIDAQEFIILRYAKSVIYKSLYFSPPRGFRCIQQDAAIKEPVHPFIEQYRVFINKGHKNFARLFFYADAAQVATKEPWYKALFSSKSVQKQLHPLITKLQDIKSTPVIRPDEQWHNQSQGSEFDKTDIFVDKNISLEELHQQVNKNIQLSGDAYYLKEESFKKRESRI